MTSNVLSTMNYRLTILGLFVFAGPALAQTPRVAIDAQAFELANGLRVIVHRDTTIPVVTTNIWYHAGSARERPGRTGFAHLFEHIMFEGSRNVPEGRIDEWFEEAGGSPNGSTSRDRTNYFQTFSRNALDMALFIEADRMGFLLDAMSRASVDGQRDVVKNERRQSYDNRPYGLASQILSEHLYPEGHPYRWPVVGYMDDLTRAEYDDVVDFFRRYYAPNNATLAIAGDVDPAETRRLVEKWFGALPRGEPVPELAVETPPLSGETRIALEDRVQLPRLYLTWRSPAAWSEDDAVAAAAARVLGGGKNSRLFRRLVYELQIADDVRVSHGGEKLAGEFDVVATARAGHTLDELLRVIDEEVARLAAEPPTDHELMRVVNQYEVGFLESLESVSAKADRLNYYMFHLGQPNGFQRDLERVQAVTPEAVASFARQWLRPDRRVVLSIVPRGQSTLAASRSRILDAKNMADSPGAR